MLNHIIAKPIREHLPRQRRDGHARTLALQDVAEVFKSEYRRRTTECFSLKAGMFVRQTISYEVYMLRDVPWVWGLRT